MNTVYTTGPIHHSPDNSRQGHQLVYALDGHLFADVGAYNRSGSEDTANALRVVDCWNACEGIPVPSLAIPLAIKQLLEARRDALGQRQHYLHCAADKTAQVWGDAALRYECALLALGWKG